MKRKEGWIGNAASLVYGGNMTRYLVGISILGTILIIGAFSMQFCPNLADLSNHSQNWLFSILLNLGSGLIASVIVIKLYNMVLDQKAQDDRHKKQQVALSLLHEKLNRQLMQLYGIFKSTTAKEPDQVYNSFEAFFNDEYYNTVALMDISKPVHPFEFPYSDLLYQSLSEFTTELINRINDVLVKYADCLDSELVETMDKLVYCTYVKFASDVPKEFERYNMLVEQGTSLPDEWHPRNFGKLNNSFRFYVSQLILLINQYNKIVPEPSMITFDQRYWENNAVKPGSNLGSV
jgi:hypothetical protein